VNSELKVAQRDLAGFSSTFDRQLAGLRGARESFRQITAAQREAEGAVSAFTAEIATQTQALDSNAEAARRAKAAQQFFNNRFAPGLNSAGTSEGDQREIAAVLRAAEARDLEIQKIRQQTEASEALAAAQQRMARARALYESNGASGRGDVAAINASQTALADLLRAEQAAAAEMEDMRQQAVALRNALNPLAVVEQRLATETARLAQLQKAGVITAREYADGLKLLQADAKRAADAIRVGGSGSPGGMLFGLRPFEIQNLQFQVNDLVTQIASGTSVSQAFAQQIGQIIQIFPRVGNAIFGAFASGPVLAFVAALATVGIGLNRVLADAQQLRTFESALIASGNGAQYQAAALANAARELDRYGLSADEAVAAVRLFVREGIDPSRLEEFGLAAKNLSRVLGIDVADAAKLAADGFTGGFEAVERFQQATDSLTGAELERIDALFRAGRAEEARALAFDLTARKFDEAAAKARGPWTQAFETFGRAWDTAVRALANSDFIQNTARELDWLARNLLLTAQRIERLGLAGAALRNLRDDPIVSTILGPAPADPVTPPLRPGAAARAAGAGGRYPAAAAAEQRLAAERRLTAEMREQRIQAAAVTSQAVIQQKLTLFRAKTLRELQNDPRFRGASDVAITSAADAATAQERGRLREQLSAFQKRQAAEREREGKAGRKRLEDQRKFNAEVDEENLKRQEAIANATRLQGLSGAALIDAEKAIAVEEAVAAQRARATREQVTFTAQQEQATRALAAAEFEATRGAEARADAARQAVDLPIDQLTALRSQLQGDLQTAAAAGQAGRVGEIQTQLDGVNGKLREATAAALAFYRSISAGTVAFPGTQAELDGIIAKLQAIQNAAPSLGVYFGVAGEQIAQAFAGNAASAIDGFAQRVAEGANAFEAVRTAFLQFAADFLRQIAQMIIQQTVLNLVSGVLGSIGGGTAPAAHGGGIIGRHKACRLVVVTDRRDLEKQLSGNFMTGGAFGSDIGSKDAAKAKAQSGRDLARRIGKGTERIIFTIINKFGSAAKYPECHNETADMIVLVDEGHRSQGGENHERMRNALPNAAYVAFTGIRVEQPRMDVSRQRHAGRRCL
jgi:hypothetical protein